MLGSGRFSFALIFGSGRVTIGFSADGGFAIVASVIDGMLGSGRFPVAIIFARLRVGFGVDGGVGIIASRIG